MTVKRAENSMEIRAYIKARSLPCLKHTVNKVLHVIFFDNKGSVMQLPVPKGRTLTGAFYKCCFHLIWLPVIISFFPNSNCILSGKNICQEMLLGLLYISSSWVYLLRTLNGAFRIGLTS